jgi:hypothetical protein
MRKNLNIAMIGSGFMGRAHSNVYRQANSFFFSGCRGCARRWCAPGTEARRGSLQSDGAGRRRKPIGGNSARAAVLQPHGRKWVPDFSDGQTTQMVCDAILAYANKEQWMKTGP